MKSGKIYLLKIKGGEGVKKYAVYGSETGQYYYQYADTIELLEGTGFEDIITEEQLPVVFDGRGGYFAFDPDDKKFVEIIESDEEVPLPLERMFYVNQPEFKLGWMSPEGDTYSCSYTNHTKCAKMLAKKFYPRAKFPELALDRAGWLKIIDSWDGSERRHGQFVYTERGRVTKKQADRLFDLGLYDNEEVRELIRTSEDDW
mgnify:CR=1 FL=1